MSIQLCNLEFYYPKTAKKPVLHIDNWSLPGKEKCFIYGPSGSGKSTLLNLISGLLRPTSGRINVLGEQLETMSSRQRDKFRANNIGYIFQQFNLIQYLNAVENIKLANHFSAGKADTKLTKQSYALLDMLGICERDWHRPVSQMSIGQQQRVSIARALINRPRLLIADEPTSALDSNARNNFMTLLTSLCQESKTTLLFVSHDMQLKPHFDSVQALSEINAMAGKH